jgi:hypothetical protein
LQAIEKIYLAIKGKKNMLNAGLWNVDQDQGVRN